MKEYEIQIPLRFRWQKAGSSFNTPNAKIRNLDEGTEYEFRVMAENALGISEPLLTTAPIKAKHPFGSIISYK